MMDGLDDLGRHIGDARFEGDAKRLLSLLYKVEQVVFEDFIKYAGRVSCRGWREESPDLHLRCSRKTTNARCQDLRPIPHVQLPHKV